MNKSALPMTSDSLSLNLVSISKPIKKTATNNPASHDSFAEHLSQSRRDLLTDKRADSAKQKIHHEQPKKVAAEDPADKHHSLNETRTNQESSDRKILSHTEKSLNNHKSRMLEEDSDTTRDNSPDLITSTDSAQIKTPVEDSALSIAILSAEERLQGEAVLSGEATESPDEQYVLPSLTESDSLLAVSESDNPVSPYENWVGDDDWVAVAPRSDVPLTSDRHSSIATLDGSAVVAEVMDAGETSSKGLTNAGVSTAATLTEWKPMVASSVTSSTFDTDAGLDADKNPLGLSLELTQEESEASLEFSLDDPNLLVNKSEDKSAKVDLFKWLLTQAQTEKSTLTNEKPLTEPATVATTSMTGQPIATANRLFVPHTQLAMNFAHPHWGNAVGEKVLWMANQQLSTADIRLDPPELGSLQVRVSVQQDQANITFISPHPQVRELLDQQINRLREMFADQGLQLGQVDIADRREQESRQSGDESKSKGEFATEHEDDIPVTTVSSLYLVDQFV